MTPLRAVFLTAVLVSVSNVRAEVPEPVKSPAVCDSELLYFLKRESPESPDGKEKLTVDWAGLAAFGMEDDSNITDKTLCRARAAFLYADLAPSTEKGESEKYYKRARVLALKVIRSREKHGNIRDTYRAVPEHLSQFDTQDGLALSWFAVSWGHVLDRLSFWTAAAQAKDVEKLMLRVTQLAPGIEGAGAEVFLATYYYSLPKMFGQDVKKALRYADTAIAAPGLNNCRIAILQGVLGLELSKDKMELLKTRRQKPVDYSAPYAFENAVCQ